MGLNSLLVCELAVLQSKGAEFLGIMCERGCGAPSRLLWLSAPILLLGLLDAALVLVLPLRGHPLLLLLLLLLAV